MTGYGDAEGVFEGITYAVEIKTVNNRYLKTRLRLPDAVAFLEEDINRLIKRELSRGFVNYCLVLKDAGTEVLFDVDKEGLKKYAKLLKESAEEQGLDANIDLANLLELPGIIQPKTPDEDEAVRIKEFVGDLTKEALEKLTKMRALEGEALATDLQNNCSEMRGFIDEISDKSDLLPGQYQNKLKTKVDSLLKEAKLELDDETLAREVAVYAEKADISEELARLESHIVQFEEALLGDDLAGKRLDFISQEMLREANTIASKACDTEIVHYVVELKCRIDRIKEQVQNVE